MLRPATRDSIQKASAQIGGRRTVEAIDVFPQYWVLSAAGQVRDVGRDECVVAREVVGGSRDAGGVGTQDGRGGITRLDSEGFGQERCDVVPLDVIK